MRRLEEHRAAMRKSLSATEIANVEKISDKRLQNFKDAVTKDSDPKQRAFQRTLLLKIINAYNLGEFNE